MYALCQHEHICSILFYSVYFSLPVTSFTLSGYSRAHSATVSNPDDYSIYCDLTVSTNTQYSNDVT